MRLLLAYVALSLGWVAGCAGTETGNGQKPKDHVAKVEMKLTDGNAPASQDFFVAADVDGAELTLTDAWASVDVIDLRLAVGLSCADVFDAADAALAGVDPVYESRCSDDDEAVVRIDGPFWVDLVTGVAEPALDMVYVPPGDYVGGRVKLHPRSPASPHGDAFEDATLAAEGTLADGAAFKLGLRFTATVSFDGAFSADDMLSGIMLLLDVDGWFAELPFSTCADNGDFTVDADGAYVISDGKGGCADAEQAITRAIKASGHLSASD